MAQLPTEKTNNPAGSTAPVDLRYNTAALDCLINGDQPVPDRFGRNLVPWRSLGAPLVFPAVAYGSGQIVEASQVDPGQGRYSVNQLFQYNNGGASAAVRFAGTNAQLPYDLSQPFDNGVWSAAYINIVKVRSPANFSVTNGQTRITPVDGNGDPLFINDADIHISGAKQIQGRNFNITQNQHIDLIGAAFDGTEIVEWVVNAFIEDQSLAVAGVESVTVPTFADIALLNTDNYPGVRRIYTQGFDAAGVGGAEFIRDDSATPSLGYASTTQNGQTWRQVNEAEVYSDSIGADPTYATDSAGDIELLNALVASSDNVSKGVIQTGRYRIEDTAINIRSTEGYTLAGESYQSILDASEATTEFDVIAPPSGTDPVEGLLLSGLRIRGSNIGSSYAANLSKWRNASNLRDFRIGEGRAGNWGVNGIRHNATWYGSVTNGLIRNMSGIGAKWESLGIGDGVNGIHYSSVFFNGNTQNLVTEATTQSSNAAALFSGCTFERSRLLSNSHTNHFAVKYDGCYFEGNGQDVTSGATDIFAGRVSSVVLDTCFLNGFATAPSDSPMIDSELGGIVHIKDGSAISTHGRPLFGSDTQITLGHYVPIDHTPAYRTRFSQDKMGGNAVQMVKGFDTLSYARQTSMPLAGTLTSYTGLRVIQVLDFATLAANEAFGFEVVVQDAFRGTEVRYGRQRWAVAVRKQDSQFYFDDIEIYNLSGADNAHAVVSFLYSGSQVSIRVDTANSGTAPELLNWVIEPVLAQLNDRFTIGAGF